MDKREITLKAIDELIDDCANRMKAHAAKAIGPQGLDPATHGNPRRLPRAVLLALLQYEYESWKPQNPNAQADADEVYRILRGE